MTRLLGVELTVNVATVVVALPAELVKTARYRSPLSAEVGVNASVSAAAPGTSVKVVPPSLLTCHCTVGAGTPDAAATNDTGLPALTVWLVGLVVTVKPSVIVTLAAVAMGKPSIVARIALLPTAVAENVAV